MEKIYKLWLIPIILLWASAYAQGSHFTFTSNTGNNMTVIVPFASDLQIGGNRIESGDEIGVFTPDGLCVGASVWGDDSNNVAIVVWGNNEFSDEPDGMEVNENLHFKVYKNHDTIDVVVTYSSGNPFYTVNGISVIESMQSTGNAPEITTQPVDTSVISGDAVIFSVIASGTGTLSYQWYKDSVPISRATSSTYRISSASSTDQGSYFVKISNSYGEVSSTEAYLAIVNTVVITEQPQGLSATEGDSVAFSVTVTGTEPITYQWQKNGNNIAKATESTYTISSVAASDEGTYKVVISNAAGSISSKNAVLTVISPPAITRQPVSITVTAGDEAEFSVTASGSEPLSYQWKKDKIDIAGATSSQYRIKDVTLSDEGTYTVTVSNDAGSVTSGKATLTVTSAPVIVTQPVNQTVTEEDTASFFVEASGTEPLNYQWYKNGVIIKGATSPKYDISPVKISDEGTYTVTVSNDAGSVTSGKATLTVTSAPVIVTQPVNQTVTEEDTASFFVEASGTEPLDYQWYKNGVIIKGATSPKYDISPVSISDDGTHFSVKISNSAGEITSDRVVLNVLRKEAPAILESPQSQIVKSGNPVTFSVRVSGTAPLRYQWRKDGADISGATTSTYSISSVKSSHAGIYRVQITNSFGEILSEAASLELVSSDQPVAITTQPQSRIISSGDTVLFSVRATGTAPLSYQWQKDGKDLAGENSATLILYNVSSDDEAVYTCVVKNSKGPVTSAGAKCVVQSLPVILSHPRSRTVQSGDPVIMQVQVSGSSPVTYQWKKNGSNVRETSHQLTITSATSSDAGTYSCVVSNEEGSTETMAAELSVVNIVKEKPIIFLSRRNIIFEKSGSDTIFIVNSGSGELPSLNVSLPGKPSWLNATIDNSHVNASLLAISANTSGLTSGLYTETVEIKGTSVEPVKMTVTLSIGENTSVPTKIVINPVRANCTAGKSIAFSAKVYDRNNKLVSAPVSWAVTKGSGTINNQGVFTSTGATGVFTINARISEPFLEGSELFNVSAEPLKLVSPCGGEVYQAGQRTMVEFTADPVKIDAVNIEVSLDGGFSWNKINETAFSASDPGWGAYQWDIEDNYKGVSSISQNCKIRVVSANDDSSASSGGIFSIVAPVARLIDADGGNVSLNDEVKVEVPSGSITNNSATISLVQTRTTVQPPSGLQLESSGDVFVFTPHGTQFKDSVTISLPYSGLKDNIRILRRKDEDSDEWEVISSLWFDEISNPGIVFFKVTSFSVYAVASPEEFTELTIPVNVTAKRAETGVRNILTSTNNRLLTFSFGTVDNHTITLFRIDGSVVKSINTKNQFQTINLDMFPSGIYLVNVKNSCGTVINRRFNILK